MGVIYLLGFYIEFFLLIKIEKKRWNTLYTPICLLMLPYAILLPISIIAIECKSGYDFYYPSILIWMVGLLVFEIPSIILSNSRNLEAKIERNSVLLNRGTYKNYLKSNTLIVLLFLFRFLQVARTGIPIGSDEFGEAFATYGIWGHLNLLLIMFTIGDIILLNQNDKNSRLLIFLIFCGSLVCFLNQVKGWVLIPIVGGIIVRLKDGTLRLRPKLIVLICILGSSLFFLSYYVALVLLRSNSDNGWFLTFFIEHYIFYLTSGINGLSEFCQSGYLIRPDSINAISKMFYPLQIVVDQILGEQIIHDHGIFIDIAYGESNVRTFFGDLFLRGGVLGGIVLTLFNSLVCYFVLWLTNINSSLFFKIAYGFVGGILAMGWFSSYTHLLNTYEVPIFCLLIYLCQNISLKIKHL